MFLSFRSELQQSVAGVSSTSYVSRIDGRVWSADAVGFLIRPIRYRQGDPLPGPWTHVLLKPNGVAIFTRPATQDDGWEPAALRHAYAATVDDEGVWRGELKIPWHALYDATDLPRGRRPAAPLRPEMVLLNATRHDAATGHSASWAGPIDTDRQTSVTGALVLRQR